MSKNLEELKKICSEKTKDYSQANVRKERSLIEILEGFEKRIKKLEIESVVHGTYFPYNDRKKVLEGNIKR